MIILDKPYVSTFLAETIMRLDLPVLKNQAVEDLAISKQIQDQLFDDVEFVRQFKQQAGHLLYCNSENPIQWISENLAFTDLPRMIEMFKDKVQYREAMASMYPDFFYKEVRLDELDSVDISAIAFPFIIKPSIGFFSMGVYKVSSSQDWERIIHALQSEVQAMEQKYPIEVVNASHFIIEENIDGDEFAIDVYYDKQGMPVILNILEHIFSSGEDVSDRVYITSKEIIEKHHNSFVEFFEKMGEIFNVKGFPMHVEVRVDQQGHIVPIEVNPMRFAGWCTTDVAMHAYGINVYEYFFMQKKPDWQELLQGKENKIYSIVVADVPKGLELNTIEGFDYEKFANHFENPLEVRKMDYKKHGVFAFLFAETSIDSVREIEEIVKSDLEEYILFNF